MKVSVEVLSNDVNRLRFRVIMLASVEVLSDDVDVVLSEEQCHDLMFWYWWRF